MSFSSRWPCRRRTGTRCATICARGYAECAVGYIGAPLPKRRQPKPTIRNPRPAVLIGSPNLMFVHERRAAEYLPRCSNPAPVDSAAPVPGA
mmetsp:Transcript_2458/g.6016  ORF Transcript_2458/g.6016 Transcript_2458/m.6016 type:complete len:92 (-) Transcript_2458:215-490(-)